MASSARPAANTPTVVAASAIAALDASRRGRFVGSCANAAWASESIDGCVIAVVVRAGVAANQAGERPALAPSTDDSNRSADPHPFEELVHVVVRHRDAALRPILIAAAFAVDLDQAAGA